MKTKDLHDFGNSVALRVKVGNFAESDEFAINLRYFHITDFWVNLKNDESREIFTPETRDIKLMSSLQLLVGVDL